MNPEINIQPLREVSLPYGNLRSQLLDGAILFRGNIVEELWKPVKGYEGYYEVSNHGRICGLERYVGRINNSGLTCKRRALKPRQDQNGYLLVSLCRANKGVTKRIHILVWDAFGDKPRDGMRLQIDHIDENKLNNTISNLQLLSNRENKSKSANLKKKNHLPIGVFFDSKKQKYVAAIKINYKKHHLGTYNTPEEASRIYQDKLEEYTKCG